MNAFFSFLWLPQKLNRRIRPLIIRIPKLYLFLSPFKRGVERNSFDIFAKYQTFLKVESTNYLPESTNYFVFIISLYSSPKFSQLNATEAILKPYSENKEAEAQKGIIAQQ